jgi:hemerythrin
MREHKYPLLSQHIIEHEQFYAKVAKFQNDFHDGKANLSLDVLKFLNGWLNDHIIKTDGEYGCFAKGLLLESEG